MSPDSLTPDTLTVVTLNTWKCDGAYWRRLPLMARAVAEAAPDIVFLQEVLRAPGADDADTSAVLAEATGLIAHDEKARKTRRDVAGRRVQSWLGLTILSRWPLATRRLDLPVSEGRDWDRLAQVAEGDTPLGPLTFVNLHLTHPPEDTHMRARQVATILDHLADNGTRRAIVGGDWNDTPDSPALRLVADDSRWACSHAVMEARGAVFPTFRDSGACIDHLVVLQEAAAGQRLRAVEAAPVGDWMEDGVPPSDHIGVRAVFRHG